MQKLIKISDTHYIIVDNSEIKELDSFWIIGGHSYNFGIRTCFWINKDQPCWSEKNLNWTSETCDNLYIDKYEDKGYGFVERYRALKITHSTEPLDCICAANSYKFNLNCAERNHCFGKIKTINLSEIEEIINEYDVEQMALNYSSDQGHPSPEAYSDKQVGLLHGYIDGFNTHKELTKDKLFTIDDMIKAFQTGYNSGAELDKYSPKCSSDFVKTILPKNEWNIEIDEINKIKIIK